MNIPPLVNEQTIVWNLKFEMRDSPIYETNSLKLELKYCAYVDQGQDFNAFQVADNLGSTVTVDTNEHKVAHTTDTPSQVHTVTVFNRERVASLASIDKCVRKLYL